MTDVITEPHDRRSATDGSRAGGRSMIGAPAQEERAILDLTGLPRPQRHRTVIAALEALDPDTRLVVVNDHEPTGLRIQLKRRYGGRLGWEARGGAGGRFVVAIRLAERRAAGGDRADAATGAPVGSAR